MTKSLFHRYSDILSNRLLLFFRYLTAYRVKYPTPFHGLTLFISNGSAVLAFLQNL